VSSELIPNGIYKLGKKQLLDASSPGGEAFSEARRWAGARSACWERQVSEKRCSFDGGRGFEHPSPRQPGLLNQCLPSPTAGKGRGFCVFFFLEVCEAWNETGERDGWPEDGFAVDRLFFWTPQLMQSNLRKSKRSKREGPRALGGLPMLAGRLFKGDRKLSYVRSKYERQDRVRVRAS